MATDITVALDNRPGTIAELGETLGKAGINIDGICGFPVDGQGMIHVLVGDAATARDALAEGGFDVRGQRDVLILEADDHPGELGDVTRRIADAGVNIDLLYMASRTRMVLGVDDMETAQRSL